MPNLKPLDKNSLLSDLKIRKSQYYSEKSLKLPKIRDHKTGKNIHKSVDSPLQDLESSGSSPESYDSKNFMKRKKKLESFIRNFEIQMVIIYTFFIFQGLYKGENHKNHPKFKKKIPEILDVYGIQRKKQIRFDDSMNSLKKHIIQLKEPSENLDKK